MPSLSSSLMSLKSDTNKLEESTFGDNELDKMLFDSNKVELNNKEYDESRETGKTSLNILNRMLPYGTGVSLPIIIFILFVWTQIISNLSDLWLSHWLVSIYLFNLPSVTTTIRVFTYN